MKVNYVAILASLLLLTVLSPLNAAKHQTSHPFSQVKFIPGISFILDFSFVQRNLDQEIFQGLEIPGLIENHAHEHNGHAHHPLNYEKGFNLNYGELALYATVDPYFDMFTVFHISGDAIEIEEAFVDTRTLPLGLGLKLGKFKSIFGRINEKHAHTWDFTAIPLVYQAFFGEEGLTEKGIRLSWVAPTDFYLGFQVESFQGENENSFGTSSFHLLDSDTGEEIKLEEVSLPNVWVLNSRASIDIGDIVLLGGVSCAFGKTRLDHFADEENPHGFSGVTQIWNINLAARYTIDSYRYLSCEAEYLYRYIDGKRYRQCSQEQEETHEHEDIPVEQSRIEKKHGGFYLQAVYRFTRLWRLGARWEGVSKNRIMVENQEELLPQTLRRTSIMIDFNPTEFSRIRLEYNINRYGYDEGKRKNFNSLILQFNLAIGAHGAHTF